MIVLASQSPRRAELLRNAGIEFRVQPSNVPEQRLPSETALDYVQRLAGDKAAAVARKVSGELVLGADTVVVLEQRVLEKPRDAQEANEMLRSLSGRTHQVMTGVCLLNGARQDVRAEVTEVRFTPISEEEIASYVAGGEPMDRAGAYAIQGIASRWIAGITGCYFNVVGLPVPLVYRMLRENGAL
ncbi:MAG TPA: Maf family protein [Clostridia bacterium]|nr:Maf family protein [Clostridia bacterium]